MVRTNNLNVRAVTPVIAPEDLRRVFPISEEAGVFVLESRAVIKEILHGRDPRLIVVVGPCSIHDPKAALEYGERLAALAHELADHLFIVMRSYFEKPRTTVGWKGLINDPGLNGTHEISKGLGIARGLLCSLTGLRLPVGAEMLDPITPEYLADLVTWGAIGARTAASQTHREMASGLSFPVGFKNPTDGNLQTAVDAIRVALHPHSFLGIDGHGRTSIIHTTGNPDVHIVLRGAARKTNYAPEDIVHTEVLLRAAELPVAIMVDCSHGNSLKNHENQPKVLAAVLDQITSGCSSIIGVMLESFLEEGHQPLPKDPAKLRYGVSITDACMGWDATEQVLRDAHRRLAARGGRPLA